MRAASQTQATDPLTGVGGYPLPPRPFDMGKWRKPWGVFWSAANGVSIKWAIENGRVWDQPSFAAHTDAISAAMRRAG